MQDDSQKESGFKSSGDRDRTSLVIPRQSPPVLVTETLARRTNRLPQLVRWDGRRVNGHDGRVVSKLKAESSDILNVPALTA